MTESIRRWGGWALSVAAALVIAGAVLVDDDAYGRGPGRFWILAAGVLAAAAAAVLALRSPPAPAGRLDPEVLAEQRARAERECAELEERLAAGEIDAESAERLRGAHEEEIAFVDVALARSVSAAAPSVPGDRRRSLVGSAVVIAVAVGVALGVTASTRTTSSGSDSTAPVPEADTQQGASRDLSQVTNEEMEQVIAQNPAIVPMRLALVERYLRAGELTKAKQHAKQALDRSSNPADKQRSLKYLGWATASLGEPAAGARLLEESLALAPEDLDAKWFLAQVRLEGLRDAPGAVALLESMLADQALPADKRSVVQAKLDQARSGV